MINIDSIIDFLSDGDEIFISNLNANKYLKLVSGAEITITISGNKIIVDGNKESMLEKQEIDLKTIKEDGAIHINIPQHTLFTLDIT